MSEIEKKFNELYGEFNLTPKDPAYRIFNRAGNQQANCKPLLTLRLKHYCVESLLKPVLYTRCTLQSQVCVCLLGRLSNCFGRKTMTDLQKAAEMALEELEMQVEHHSGVYLAIDALRQALAKPTRKWVGLTDEEIIELWESDNGLESCDLNKLFDFSTVVRFITKKLKEKNHE